MTAAPTSTSEPWPPSIRRVAELDWHGCESGVVGSTLVILPLFAVLAVRFDLVAVIAGVFVASGQSFLLRVWAIDERSGGAHLRHVLGIPRRTVVRARYAVAALLTLTLTALSLACVALAGLVLSRAIDEAVFGVLICGVGFALVACVLIPVRGRWGAGWAVASMLATIAAAVAVSILAATLAGVESGVGYATASLLTLLAFVLGAAPFSYTLTRRWYDSKDL